MTKDSDLQAEVAALRQEMTELQAERARRAEEQTGAPQSFTSPDNTGSIDEAQNDLAAVLEQITDAVKDFTEDAEAEFADHPSAFIAGSFLLGVVVGLLFRR